MVGLAGVSVVVGVFAEGLGVEVGVDVVLVGETAGASGSLEGELVEVVAGAEGVGVGVDETLGSCGLGCGRLGCLQNQGQSNVTF